jgi:hypothetical protein
MVQSCSGLGPLGSMRWARGPSHRKHLYFNLSRTAPRTSEKRWGRCFCCDGRDHPTSALQKSSVLLEWYRAWRAIRRHPYVRRAGAREFDRINDAGDSGCLKIVETSRGVIGLGGTSRRRLRGSERV